MSLARSSVQVPCGKQQPQLKVTERTAPVCRAAPTLQRQNPTAAEVQEAIRKSHEHHGQGRVMYVVVSGKGRKLFATSHGTQRRVLSDASVASMDYEVPGL